MKVCFIILSFIFNTGMVFAQDFVADLSLDVSSQDFSDGIRDGEVGIFTMTLTNLGPSSFPSGSEFDIFYSYNVTQDKFIIYELFDNEPISAGCEFNFFSGDPRPPIDDFFTPLHSFKLTTPLEMGQSVSCDITLSFEESGFLETRWWLNNFTDPSTDNNSASFVFFGTPEPVPLNVNIMLLFVILICAHFKLKSRIQ
ncbi:hypothetical protein OS175_01170 [Marinicella sp. S1101]|uniref:hypothetical protein n=1 Tax=Marinicella marina TaxID=2996016 RepID=UPI002260EDD3|nr:hypothetical protein [Marinicella marina]MCX7552472.1 hypothetical protein [Marinicella marina]MDJ1139348.1 hypothetical protein [Marinicella marina]